MFRAFLPSETIAAHVSLCVADTTQFASVVIFSWSCPSCHGHGQEMEQNADPLPLVLLRLGAVLSDATKHEARLASAWCCNFRPLFVTVRAGHHANLDCPAKYMQFCCRRPSTS